MNYVTFKVTCSKCMVLSERPCHKEHTNMQNMNTLSLVIKKLWPMFKNFKSIS